MSEPDKAIEQLEHMACYAQDGSEAWASTLLAELVQLQSDSERYEEIRRRDDGQIQQMYRTIQRLRAENEQLTKELDQARGEMYDRWVN
jgi:predicted  nucleic acid-binding Zn-ribbon protein